MLLTVRIIIVSILIVYKKYVGKLYSKSGKITQCVICDIKGVI